jgi:hypothetical protein
MLSLSPCQIHLSTTQLDFDVVFSVARNFGLYVMALKLINMSPDPSIWGYVARHWSNY